MEPLQVRYIQLCVVCKHKHKQDFSLVGTEIVAQVLSVCLHCGGDKVHFPCDILSFSTDQDPKQSRFHQGYEHNTFTHTSHIHTAKTVSDSTYSQNSESPTKTDRGVTKHSTPTGNVIPVYMCKQLLSIEVSHTPIL